MASPIRQPSSGAHWTEVFLEAEHAAGSHSTAESVAHGLSVLLLTSIATSEECAALRRAASTAAAEERAARGLSGLVRKPAAELLDAESVALCDVLLQRQLALLRAEQPSLLAALYGDDLAPDSCLRTDEQLVFSPGEPAITSTRRAAASRRTRTSRASRACSTCPRARRTRGGARPSGRRLTASRGRAAARRRPPTERRRSCSRRRPVVRWSSAGR